jgi:hypothetical protein
MEGYYFGKEEKKKSGTNKGPVRMNPWHMDHVKHGKGVERNFKKQRKQETESEKRPPPVAAVVASEVFTYMHDEEQTHTHTHTHRAVNRSVDRSTYYDLLMMSSISERDKRE